GRRGLRDVGGGGAAPGKPSERHGEKRARDRRPRPHLAAEILRRQRRQARAARPVLVRAIVAGSGVLVGTPSFRASMEKPVLVNTGSYWNPGARPSTWKVGVPAPRLP